MRYQIFAALHDESNMGWIWLPKSTVGKRRLVRITHVDSNRSLFCEARTIDSFFAEEYNKKTTLHINADSKDIVVISRWYRDALGLELQEKAEISVDFPRTRDWGALRAGAHHPDAMVRISTRLWILASWLSITGFLLALAFLVSGQLVLWAGALAALVGLFGLVACRGVRQE